MSIFVRNIFHKKLTAKKLRNINYMKDIIFVVNRLYGGGAERVVSILANSLCRKGHRITIYSFCKPEANYKLDPAIRLKRLDVSSRFNYLKKVKRIIKLRNALSENQCSVIAFEYFVNMQTAAASLFLKNRLVISERNDPVHTGSRAGKLRNILYRFADVLVCQTDDAKQYFPEKIKRKSVVIPNPVTQELPKPYSQRRSKEIVTFCRIEKQKNIYLLVDSFEMLCHEFPGYKLVIYGDGGEKTKLEKYIIDKGLQEKIRIFGFTPNVHKLILKSAMYVNSSDYEGLSNAMLEAMAIGLPVIATDCPCGGARAVINSGENGILVPVGDPFELYKAMKSVINNQDYAQRLSNNASKIRNELNPDKICPLWESTLWED